VDDVLVLVSSCGDSAVYEPDQTIQFVLDIEHLGIELSHWRLVLNEPLFVPRDCERVLFQPFTLALLYFRLPGLNTFHHDDDVLELLDRPFPVHDHSLRRTAIRVIQRSSSDEIPSQHRLCWRNQHAWRVGRVYTGQNPGGTE
jgi:hypothetical protein